MKKVAIICAAGKQGTCLVNEAVARGYDVTGFVRNGGKEINPQAKKVVKDLFDLEAADLREFDVVIDAFGAWTPETLPLHRPTLKHLCDLLGGTDARLLVVGGAGSLYTDAEHTTKLMDLPTFPADYKPVAYYMGIALDELRKRRDVKWTYLSPAADFRADGARTGKYLLGGEEYFENARGESAISYRDYAAAMIDEIANARFVGKRFAVVGA